MIKKYFQFQKQYGTEDMILLQHTQDLLEKVKSTSEMNIDESKSFSQQYDSVYCNQASSKTNCDVNFIIFFFMLF
jgi:hypothetical protein